MKSKYDTKISVKKQAGRLTIQLSTWMSCFILVSPKDLYSFNLKTQLPEWKPERVYGSQHRYGRTSNPSHLIYPLHPITIGLVGKPRAMKRELEGTFWGRGFSPSNQREMLWESQLLFQELEQKGEHRHHRKSAFRQEHRDQGSLQTKITAEEDKQTAAVIS